MRTQTQPQPQLQLQANPILGLTSQQQASNAYSYMILQWCILIAALLAIVLLILLILRKLLAIKIGSSFPSYQWMLAKQMIKSTSNRLGSSNNQLASADCCQFPPHHMRYHQPQSCQCPSSQAATILLSSAEQAVGGGGGGGNKPNLCYTCHHSPNQLPLDHSQHCRVGGTIRSNPRSLNLQPYGCVMDAKGRHLIAPSTFNTDLRHNHHCNTLTKSANHYTTQLFL